MARLFVAYEVPKDLTAQIAAWQATALDEELWRPVRPESLHLTLVFLGARREAEIGPIASLVGAALPQRAGTMRLRPALTGIPRRRPRALAFAADAREASDLAQRLSGELADAGLHERERRPYWPHLTVARLRRSHQGPPRRIPSRPLPAPACAPFSLRRVVLYRSETRPEGARHIPEADFTISQ